MESWTITDHVCRVCMGRILTTRRDGKLVSRCADCEIEAVGSHKALCACGAKTRAGKDAGLRCIRNESHSPGGAQAIMVSTGNPPEYAPPRQALGRTRGEQGGQDAGE